MKVVAIKIEAGARHSRCEGCGRAIWWGKHPSTGKPVPVSINGAYLSDARMPTSKSAGVGINHFIDCPSRAEHRKPKEPQPELALDWRRGS